MQYPFENVFIMSQIFCKKRKIIKTKYTVTTIIEIIAMDF